MTTETTNPFWLFCPALELAGVQDGKSLRYWKDVLACGHYTHPTQEYPKGHPKAGQFIQFNVDRDDLNTAISCFNEMSAVQDDPAVVKDHNESSDNTLGYIKGARINPDNPDRLQMLHEFVDEKSRDIALRNKVSAKLVPNYRMSNGKVLPLAISHVATTPKPVITQQSDWAIAAGRGSDDVAVLFLTASQPPEKENDMKITPEQLKRVKAIDANATDDTAFDLILSAAESKSADLLTATAKLAKANAELDKLKKLPGAVELSASEKADRTENLDNFIELKSIENQWPDAVKALVKKELAGDELYLSRDGGGVIRARKLIDALAPHFKPGLLANGKQKTGVQLSRQNPPDVEADNDQNAPTGVNPYADTIKGLEAK